MQDYTDDQLVSLTDELLDGTPGTPPEDLQDLYTVVEQIYNTVEPDTPPSASFKMQTQKKLIEEWEKSRQSGRIIRWRGLQMAAMAAAIIASVSLVYLLSAGEVPSGEDNTGTALEGDGLIIILALLLAGSIAYFIWRRRHFS